jgi:hypothetical protein
LEENYSKWKFSHFVLQESFHAVFEHSIL